MSSPIQYRSATPADVEAVAQILDRPREGQCVQLAIDTGSLVGFVCAFAAHDPRWRALLDNLHVGSRSKRSGIGTSLMSRAGSWLARNAPDSGVYLWVLESNDAARRFYAEIGGRNAGVTVMETNGGAVVRSCRYVWERAQQLADCCDETTR